MGRHIENLPDYSRKNELMNSISHLVGAAFAIAAFILSLTKEVKLGIPFVSYYPFYIYVFTMLTVFVISTLYHASPLKSKLKAVLRIIDHCDIYLFVAGTYTPICLYGFSNINFTIALLAIEWSLALAGILLSSINLHNRAISIITYVIYLVTGWALILFYPFDPSLNFLTFLFMLLGGISYTAGAVLYALGHSKHIYLHSVFHLFVVLGAVLQFIGIWYLL